MSKFTVINKSYELGWWITPGWTCIDKFDTKNNSTIKYNIHNWVVDNCTDDVVVLSLPQNRGEVSLFFKNEQDAVMFKLVWIGKNG